MLYNTMYNLDNDMYHLDNDMYHEDGDIYCGQCGYVGWAIKKKKTKYRFTDGFYGIIELLLGKLNITKETTYYICPKCGSNNIFPATESIKNYKRPW